MPVDFTHVSGRHLDMSGRYICRDREVARVGDSHVSAGRGRWRLLHHPEDHALGYISLRIGYRDLFQRRWKFGLENEQLVLWDLVECLDVDVEVPGQRFLAGVREKVADGEGAVFRKLPSGNASRNSQPSSASPWIECGMPDGKYQRSPGPTSAMKLHCPRPLCARGLGVVTSRQSKQTLFGEGVGDFRNGPDFRGPPAVKIIHRKIRKIKNATTITRIVIALENVARMTICARESSVGLSFR
jgi:hypothetical protein